MISPFSAVPILSSCSVSPISAAAASLPYPDGAPPREDPDPGPPGADLPPRPRHEGRGDRDRPLRGGRRRRLRARLPIVLGRGGRDPAPGGGHPRGHGAPRHARLAPLRAGGLLLGAPRAPPARRRRAHGPHRGGRGRRGGFRSWRRRGRGARRAHDRGGGALLLHGTRVALRVLLRGREISTSDEENKERCNSN